MGWRTEIVKMAVKRVLLKELRAGYIKRELEERDVDSSGKKIE